MVVWWIVTVRWRPDSKGFLRRPPPKPETQRRPDLLKVEARYIQKVGQVLRMTNKDYTSQPATATGYLGDEASMIAHVASFGVTWIPEPTFPDPPPLTAVWKEVQWSRWKMRDISRWTFADRSRLTR